MSNIASPPSNDSLIETDENIASRRDPFYISKSWQIWLQQSLVDQVQSAPSSLRIVVLIDQNATIGATPIPLASITAGQYRLQWYARITTPDGVASSLTISAGWTESATTLSISGAAMTGDTTTTVQTGTLLLQADANAAITYSAVYSSNTPGAMRFRLSISLEGLP